MRHTEQRVSLVHSQISANIATKANESGDDEDKLECCAPTITQLLQTDAAYHLMPSHFAESPWQIQLYSNASTVTDQSARIE